MIHDQDLVDLLSAMPAERFDGEVFRVTPANADPTASSVNGGRWAPAPLNGFEVAVLYTSFLREGALAEVASYLAELTPMPKARALKVSRLAVSTGRTLRIAKASLEISTPPRPASMTDAVWNGILAEVDARLAMVGKEFLAVAMPG